MITNERAKQVAEWLRSTLQPSRIGGNERRLFDIHNLLPDLLDWVKFAVGHIEGIEVERNQYLEILYEVEIDVREITEVTIIDPDTKLPVEVTIFKEAGGGMFGVDSSFLSNTDDDFYSPFSRHTIFIQED